jgi:hypothetical protein
VSLLYRVQNIETARALETMFPGVSTEYQGSSGEKSDGKRKREYVPANNDVRLILSHAEKGKVIFDGAAEIRMARFNVSAKASTVQVNVRLLQATAATGHMVWDYLGDEVELDFTKSNRALPFPKKGEDDEVEVDETLSETSSAEFALVPEVGNLVVVRDEIGGTEYGVVRAIDNADPEQGDVVIAYSEIGINEHTICLLGQVENCVAVCTPNGANSERSLRRVWSSFKTQAEDRGRTASVRDLVVAIASASGRGLIEQKDNGWPITDAVIALAVGGQPKASEAS